MKTLIRIMFLLGLGLLTACGGAPGGGALEPQAATIYVTTTDDEFNEDGDCSLREAVVSANYDTQKDGCRRGSGADTIVLEDGQVYPLKTQHNQASPSRFDRLRYHRPESALPYVSSAITIQGNGATLQGGGVASNLVLLAVDSDGVVELHNLTLSGGATGTAGEGGAITNYGTVTAENVTITQSVSTARGGYPGTGSAGGVYSDGTLIFSRCNFTRNYAREGAGAVHSEINTTYQDDTDFPEEERPYAHFDQCLFEGNSTGTGVAAIFNEGYGRMLIERSAVIRNKVLEYANPDEDEYQPETPAIVRNSSFYGDHNQSRNRPALTMENVTLSMNEGPVYSAFANVDVGTARIMHSTIYKNHSIGRSGYSRGVFDAGGTLEIGHTVVADHSRSGSQEWRDCHSTSSRFPIRSLGYNFQSDGTCTFNSSSDVNAFWSQAVLLPLADNGGFAPTHELVPAWSKLWNAGATSEDTNHGTDGRLDKRIDGKEVDIGAVETCDDIAIFWLLIIPIPYCVEEQEALKLEIPLNVELSEATFDAELLELFRAPCERCTSGIGMTEAGVLRFALEEEAFHRADVEGVRLYNAEGEVVAEGERGLEVELEAGRYYLDISGEGEEGVKLPARAAVEPL